jgi:hypothetical protein
MARYLLLTAALASALVASACFGGAASPTAEAPTAPPAAVTSPVPAKPAAVPSPSPVAKPTATPEPAVETVWVGNTDGEGVFVRNSPAMADRKKAYPDNTPLTIIGPDVDGEGQSWHHVRAPDGVEGYVPVQYTVTTQP